MINTEKLLYIVFISCLLSISGFLLGYAASTVYYFTVLNAFQLNILISVILAGAAIGAVFSGIFTDKLGRKKVLILSAVLFLLYQILILMAHNIWQSFIFSFILALAIGAVSFAVPNYIAEVSPAGLRGRMVLIFQLFITIGVLASFGLHIYMLVHNLPYYVVIILGSILTVIFFIDTLILPESPHWLILCGRNSEATKSLIKLHGSNYHVELAEIKSAVAKEQITKSFPFKINCIVVILNLFSAFCGINMVVHHIPEIFSGLGMEFSPIHIIELVSVLNFIAALLGLLLVDKLGRRKLMLFGSLFMSVSLVVLSINKFNQEASIIINIAAIIIYVFSFAVSNGLLCWLINVEIFPLGFRAKGAALGAAANWMGSFLVLWLLPVVSNLVSSCIIFLFFAFICFWTFIFYLKYLPETKGIVLEKI